MGRKMTPAEKKAAAEKRKAAAVAKKAEAAAKPAEETEPDAKGGGEAAGAGVGEAVGAAPGNEPAPAAKPKPKAKEQTVDVVTVKTKRGVKSRRRIGRAFGPESVEIPIDDLTDDQLTEIENDPALVVKRPVALS